MTDDNYHQMYRPSDGSVAVRYEPGDCWHVIEGGVKSQAFQFVIEQNKYWKPWMKESVKNRHDDEDDVFARRVRRMT